MVKSIERKELMACSYEILLNGGDILLRTEMSLFRRANSARLSRSVFFMISETNCSWTFNISSISTQGASASRCVNSERCLTVLELSALKDGVKLHTGPKLKIMASRYSCALCDRYA